MISSLDIRKIERFVGKRVTFVTLWNLDQQDKWDKQQFRQDTIVDIIAEEMDSDYGRIEILAQNGGFAYSVSKQSRVVTSGQNWVAFSNTQDYAAFGIVRGEVEPNLDSYRTLLGILNQDRAIKLFIEDLAKQCTG